MIQLCLLGFDEKVKHHNNRVLSKNIKKLMQGLLSNFH